MAEASAATTSSCTTCRVARRGLWVALPGCGRLRCSRVRHSPAGGRRGGRPHDRRAGGRLRARGGGPRRARRAGAAAGHAGARGARRRRSRAGVPRATGLAAPGRPHRPVGRRGRGHGAGRPLHDTGRCDGGAAPLRRRGPRGRRSGGPGRSAPCPSTGPATTIAGGATRRRSTTSSATDRCTPSARTTWRPRHPPRWRLLASPTTGSRGRASRGSQASPPRPPMCPLSRLPGGRRS